MKRGHAVKNGGTLQKRVTLPLKVYIVKWGITANKGYNANLGTR